MNVVTACRHCNQKKSGRTPEEAKMELLYAPYVPNKAEYLILSNRSILATRWISSPATCPPKAACGRA
jgi:5-methylcytosine-specific restriction endonuclease McrA